MAGTDPARDLFGLYVLYSPDPSLADRRIPCDQRIVVGRAGGEGVTLAIEDRQVSRRHTVLNRRGEGVFIEDLGSRNGTFVDGTRLPRSRLSLGAIIRVGETLLAFGRLRLASDLPDERLVGWSAAFSELVSQVDHVAEHSLPVLLLGESGTGKSAVAEAIHGRSGRRGRFVPVNCGAIPSDLVEAHLFGYRKGAFTGATSARQGLVAEASEGTLFLDEVGALGLHQQPKLLRLLENAEYTPLGDTGVHRTDARIIAATNADLSFEAASGRFRQDLLARLAGYVITLPPLRARREDVPLLVRRFLDDFSPGRAVTWSASFLERLLLHPWPGNIRELKFLMQRLVLGLEGPAHLTPSHLDGLLGTLDRSTPSSRSLDGPVTPPPRPPEAAKGHAQPRPPRAELIQRVRACQGVVSEVAASYGKDPKQIYRWMAAYGIHADDYRR